MQKWGIKDVEDLNEVSERGGSTWRPEYATAAVFVPFAVVQHASAMAGLLHREGLDLAAADLDFDAVGRAGIESMDDSAAHQNVSGEFLE